MIAINFENKGTTQIHPLNEIIIEKLTVAIMVNKFSALIEYTYSHQPFTEPYFNKFKPRPRNPFT
jgi:hypothetical protein